MEIFPSSKRRPVRTRLPKKFRYVLYAAIVAGVCVVAHLGTSLALMAMVPEPAARAGINGRYPVLGGTLLICGGGRVPDLIRDRFVELAGGRKARIVVIPTAAGDAADEPDMIETLDKWKRRGVASARLLHTRDRDKANDPGFVLSLTEATGVWINGGHQSWLSMAYAGTEVERELQALLARGGVIGGTSAGAGVMSRVMISRGRDVAVVEQGFDLLPGVVIDQHFLRRNRMKRLLGVLEAHPDLIGLGIDEETALEVNVRHRKMTVLGKSYAVACVLGPDQDDRSPRLDIMKPGDEADLSALKKRIVNAVIPGIEVEGL